MVSEARNDNIALQALANTDKSVRDAIAKYGSQSEEVVQVLAQYALLLGEFGYEEQSQRVNERVRLMRQALGKRANGEVVAPSVDAKSRLETGAPGPEKNRLEGGAPMVEQSGAPPAEEAEVNLFNSRGEHIAVSWSGNLYTPGGKHIGRWAADLEVYLDRNGSYLGVVAEGNRLVSDRNWQFRSINFGDRGNEGNRPGWTKKRDIEAIVLPKWLDDVSLSAPE